MSSKSYRHWRKARAAELDELVEAHATIGGRGRGRRYRTQQLNRAYALLLAAHFQGFCRDLHTECVDHLLLAIVCPPALHHLLGFELLRDRKVDRGNAQPSTLALDFKRLGIEFWDELKMLNTASGVWNRDLEMLNAWRNAIAHQDFAASLLGGATVIRLENITKWRSSCKRLARAMDQVMARHLQTVTGVTPW